MDCYYQAPIRQDFCCLLGCHGGYATYFPPFTIDSTSRNSPYGNTHGCIDGYTILHRVTAKPLKKSISLIFQHGRILSESASVANVKRCIHIANESYAFSRVYNPYAVRTQPKCANESTQIRAQGRLYSTRRYRCVYADIYAISVAYHSTEMDLFYIPGRSLRIRIGCGLLANDNPAFTRKRRRIVGVFTLGTCAIPTA